MLMEVKMEVPVNLSIKQEYKLIKCHPAALLKAANCMQTEVMFISNVYAHVI